jgi:hypothetical protein
MKSHDKSLGLSECYFYFKRSLKPAATNGHLFICSSQSAAQRTVGKQAKTNFVGNAGEFAFNGNTATS